jgi:hypothetical protein
MTVYNKPSAKHRKFAFKDYTILNYLNIEEAQLRGTLSQVEGDEAIHK